MGAIYLKGLILGAGLIIAIGAQNAFVLTQGIRRKYIILIPLICSISDAVLIFMGVLGLGQILASNSLVTQFASLGGAMFLGWYGYRSFRSFFKPHALEAKKEEGPQTIKGAIVMTLAVTLLNPHVYIDTILLLGGISSQFKGGERVLFGMGAATASVLWFFSLSLGGKALAPLFRNPLSWKILDLIISLIMVFMAFTLLAGVFK